MLECLQSALDSHNLPPLGIGSYSALNRALNSSSKWYFVEVLGTYARPVVGCRCSSLLALLLI